MRILVFVLVFFSLAGTVSAASMAYPLCKSVGLKGGELLYLQKTQSESLCWEALKKSRISGSDLHKRGNSYRFAYVFGGDALETTFDPIFNVKYREVGKAGDKAATTVSVFRDEMQTSCLIKSKAGLRKYLYKTFDRTEIDAAWLNAYHEGRITTPSRRFYKFHVWFGNSLRQCARTDKAELRRLFAIADVDFPDHENILSRLINSFTATHAIAARTGKIYKSFNIEIVKGEFLGKYYSGSFSVPAGGHFEVEINDLSTYLPNDFGRRRPKVNFTITQN